VSFGWFLDGFDSTSAGFSVLDSFTVAAGASVNKAYNSAVLKYANRIRLFITLSSGTPDYTLFDYPALTATIDTVNGTAGVTGIGGSASFFVVVFIQ
jgi:hypothetical protein